MMTSSQLLLQHLLQFSVTCVDTAKPDTFGHVPVCNSCLLMYAGIITG